MLEIKLKDFSEIILEGGGGQNNRAEYKRMENKFHVQNQKKWKKIISEGIKCPIHWFKLHFFKMYILLSLGQNRR